MIVLFASKLSKKKRATHLSRWQLHMDLALEPRQDLGGDLLGLVRGADNEDVVLEAFEPFGELTDASSSAQAEQGVDFIQQILLVSINGPQCTPRTTNAVQPPHLRTTYHS